MSLTLEGELMAVARAMARRPPAPPFENFARKRDAIAAGDGATLVRIEREEAIYHEEARAVDEAVWELTMDVVRAIDGYLTRIGLAKDHRARLIGSGLPNALALYLNNEGLRAK